VVQLHKKIRGLFKLAGVFCQSRNKAAKVCQSLLLRTLKRLVCAAAAVLLDFSAAKQTDIEAANA